MKFRKTTMVFSFAFALLLMAGAGASTFGQGKGGGRPSNPGPPVGNPGSERGLGNASTKSGGRSDAGLGTASTNSHGRSDEGIARSGNRSRISAVPGDKELNRYNGISRKLGVSPATLRSRYEAALLGNPDLKFGQFVAANVIADNLHSRNPAITSSAILAGLQNGDSIGQTLKNLGVDGRDAKRIAKDAEREVKESTKH